jgi:hypothetical protein
VWVLVICVLVFTVFCIVGIFFVLLYYVLVFLCVLSVLPPSDNSIAVSNNNNNINNNFSKKTPHFYGTLWKYMDRARTGTDGYIARRKQDAIWLPITKVRTQRHSLTVFNVCSPRNLFHLILQNASRRHIQNPRMCATTYLSL